MDDRPKATRVAAYGLCIVDGHLLLVRQGPGTRRPGWWALPGGGLEWGETPESALVREIAEETALDVAAGPLVDVGHDLFPVTGRHPDPLHNVGLLYSVRILGGTLAAEALRTPDGSGVVEARWWSLESIHGPGAPDLTGMARLAVHRALSGAAPHPPGLDHSPDLLPQWHLQGRGVAPGPDLRRRLGVYTVATDRNRVLLTLMRPGDPDGGKWSLPGGALDPGEHPLDAARRETFEEAGLELIRPRLLGVDTVVFPSWETRTPCHAVRVLYRCEASGTPVVTKTDDTTVDADWFDLDEVEQLPLTSVARAGLSHLT